MKPNDKLDVILSFLENRSLSNPQEASEMIRSSNMKEREIFESALIETLERGAMSYEEATTRVQASDFTQDDKNIILARISTYEANVSVKTAQNKSAEVSYMTDPVTKEIEALKKLLPAYGAWMEGVVKKSSLTPSDRAPEDKQAIGVKTNDEKQIEEGKKAEEARMKVTNTDINPEKRTVPANAPAPKTAGTETHNSAAPKDLRESQELKNHSQYDRNVLDKELAKGKEGEAEGKKQNTEDQKMRKEYLRAADKVAVKFSAASNAWIIADKATGSPLVIASVDDITGGNAIEGEALAELKSDKFGDIIMSDIKENGLEVAARNLLGDTFDKLAAEHEATVKQAEAKKTAVADKVWTLKGIYLSLKDNLKSAATLTPIQNLFKRAEDGLAVLEAGPAEADPMLGNVAESLSGINEIGMGMAGESEDPKVNELGAALSSALGVDPAKAEEVAKAIVDAAGGGDAAGTTPLEAPAEAPAEAAAPEAPAPDKKEASKKENPFAKKDDDEKEEKGEKEGSKEDKKEDKKEDEEKSEKTGSKIAEALKRFGKGEKKLEGDYDVTSGVNLDQMGDHGKGNVTQDGKKFMTWYTLKKEFESLADKKATGKLAAIQTAMTKLAKGESMGMDEYYKLAYGPDYGKQLTHDYTQNEVKSEAEKLDSELMKGNNAYASGATKMKKAVKATDSMVKKGLLGNTDAEKEAQIESFMAMDENTLNAFVDSTERLAATTELEDGRFKVAIMSSPDQYGNIVQGLIDGKVVAAMNGEDIKSPNGRVTKANLIQAMNLLKTAMKEGIFEEALSDGAIKNTPGVDLGGLNLGQDKVRPVLTPEDLM